MYCFLLYTNEIARKKLNLSFVCVNKEQRTVVNWVVHQPVNGYNKKT